MYMYVRYIRVCTRSHISAKKTFLLIRAPPLLQVVVHWDTSTYNSWMTQQSFIVSVPPDLLVPAVPSNTYWNSNLSPNICESIPGQHSRYYVFTCEKEGHQVFLLRNSWVKLAIAEVDIRVWDFLGSEYICCSPRSR